MIMYFVWCLTVEVLATKVVVMGEKAQLLEKNALRASMVHFVKYVQLVLVPPHCIINLGIDVDMPPFAPYRNFLLMIFWILMRASIL